jgi:recombination protein RecT
MTDQPNKTKALTISNYDRAKAMSKNENLVKTFMQVMGNRASALAFISSAMIAISSNKDLMECEPQSLWTAALRCATMGLSCDPALAQAHLVPFKDHTTGRKVATVIPGWRGIKQIALSTNKYRSINASELYEGQALIKDPLTGITKFQGQRISNLILGYFSHFEMFSGYTSTLYMTVEELQAHGQRYAPKNPKWREPDGFHFMALKTVTRLNLLRNGYLDTRARTAMDAANEETENAELVDTTIDGIVLTDEEVEAVVRPPSRPAATVLKELGFDTDPGQEGASATATEAQGSPLEKQPEQPPLVEKEGQKAQATPTPDSENQGSPLETQKTGSLEVWQMDSGNHPYDEMDSAKLGFHLKGLESHRPKTDLDQRKIAYIRSILGKRASHA